jgi:PAS domain S-box-containing protein
MNMLFGPAITLLNRLKYPQKFALISLLFAVPLALTIVLFVQQIDATVDFARQELDGTVYLRPLRRLFEHLLIEQRVANTYLNGDATQQAALAASQSQIDQDIQALLAVDQRLGDQLQTAGRASALEASWRELKARFSLIHANQSDDMHARLIADTRALIALVGDSSKLILDPDLDSYYMMDAVLLKLPEGYDLLSQVRTFGERVASQRGISTEDKAQFTILSGLVSAHVDATRRGTAVAFRENPAVRAAIEAPYQAYVEAAGSFLEQTNREIIYAATIRADPALYAAAGERALGANAVLWDRSNDILAVLLQTRADRFSRQKTLALGITGLVLVAVAYLWVAFYLAVMRTVSTLEGAAKRMSSGDMRELVQLDNRDELGQVARSFNQVATALLAASAQRQAVVDNAVDGILTIDEGGIIRSFNPAAARIFDRRADEAIGQPIAALIPAPHDREYQIVGVGREVVGRRKADADSSGDEIAFPLDLAIGEMRTDAGRAFIAIVHDLTERKRAEAERVQLQEQIIGAQAAALAELSTPLIPISDRVLAMPLIGSIDAQRADQMLTALLHGIERSRAKVAILDITGVPVVDTHVAKTLIAAARGGQLLGAEIVLTGLRPEVAQTLVGLGIDLGAIVTRSTLQSGIAYATNGAGRK